MAKSTASAPSEPRSRRVAVPSARVVDPSNIGDKQLSFHKRAQELEIQRLQDLAAEKAAQAEKASHPESQPTKRPIAEVLSDAEPEIQTKRRTSLSTDIISLKMLTPNLTRSPTQYYGNIR